MFTGFQLDSESPRLPHGLRIIVALTAESEESFAMAITPIGVISNYVFTRNMLDEDKTRPNLQDKITVEYTPKSLAQRHIIQLPEQQRILIGNLPDTFTFDIYIERKFKDDWKTTNRVLAVTDGHEIKLFQAKEFTKEFKPSPIIIASAEPEIRPEPENILEQLPVEVVIPEPVVVPDQEVTPVPEPIVVATREIEPIAQALEKVENLEVEKVGGPIVLAKTTQLGSNASDVLSSKVTQIQWHDPAKRLFKLRSLANLRKRFVVTIDVAVVLFALIIFTPLGLVHPNQPDTQSSKIVVTWPSHNPNVGDRVATSVIDQAGVTYIYVGKVETKSGDLYLLRNGENYLQVNSAQLQGKVLISIPALGRLF